MAIKTNYKFEKMERDRLKAEKKKKRLEEKRMNQFNPKTNFHMNKKLKKSISYKNLAGTVVTGRRDMTL